MADIRPIVSFLESLEFECHLNADNEYSFVVWQGQTIYGLSQEMALRNGLSNWLRNELGQHWRLIPLQRIDEWLQPELANQIVAAVNYHKVLESSMYGDKR